MLLYGGQKVFRRLSRKDHGLPAECSHLCSSDIKRIAELSYVTKGQIRSSAHQPVSQAGSVQIQRDLIIPADLRDLSQLLFCIQCPELCRMGNIHKPREHHVLMILILIKSLKIPSQFIPVDLSGMSRNGEHLMPGELHRSRLMDGYVPAVRGNDALIALQHGVNHHSIGLCSSYKEMNLRILTAAGFPYLSPCTLTV